jgi:alpha-N-arabinofuranosidase
METISRSSSPWGPFESCPHNPILSHRNLGAHPIQVTGHGDLVQDHAGNWWMVFLAVRPWREHLYHLGRETFLTPVTWTDDGWPVVGHDGTVDLEMDGPVFAAQQPTDCPIIDDFDSSRLAFCWNFLGNPRREDWTLTERPGLLGLACSPVTLDQLNCPTFVGRRQQHLNCRAVVKFAGAAGGQEAGLTAFMNREHHYDIAVGRGRQGREVFVRKTIGDLQAIVARRPAPDGPVKLFIDAEPATYTFGFAVGSSPEEILATGMTKYLAPLVASPSWMGVYFGIYCTGTGQKEDAGGWAWFDRFEYLPGTGPGKTR